MQHHRYISFIAFAGAVAWLAWLLVLFKLNPDIHTGLSMTFFFLTLFIALSSTFAVLGFYFRIWLFKNEIFYKHIGTSFRQGVFLAFISVISLAFQRMQVLSWWSGMLLVVIFVLLEFYFSAKDSEASSGYR
ncbi:hypothetical protein JKY72_00475 [Candidatus Gracilibacteria bacterium]|nr:hypothetical protein [Candidatus Gracilibacteria bacterium]